MTKFEQKSFSVGGWSKKFADNFHKVFGSRKPTAACTKCIGEGCMECLGTGKRSYQRGAGVH